jgi:hypothetical protein
MQVSGQSPPTAYRLFLLVHSNYENALAYAFVKKRRSGRLKADFPPNLFFNSGQRCLPKFSFWQSLPG